MREDPTGCGTRNRSDLVGARLVVDNKPLDVMDCYNEVFRLASLDGILPEDTVTDGVFSRYAYSQRDLRPALPREWFAALGKLGYKVWLCN